MVNEGEDGKGMLLDGVLETMPVFAKELVAGGIAGGFAKTVVALLDRTRRAEFQATGLLESVKRIAKTEGLWGFFRGNGASVARIIPYAALHCMSYVPNVSNGTTVDLVAGSLSGGTAVF